MKCIYYSRYPYVADDFRCITDPRDTRGKNSAYDMPFRLYKAAECTTNKPISWRQFVSELWEIMDMPKCKGIEDIYPSYQLDGITVVPTKHFYGATNSNDGIYEINGIYFTINEGGVKRHSSWESAFDACYNYREIGRMFLKGKQINK